MLNIVAVGRLAADPETRQAGDTELAAFRLGVDSGYDPKTKERQTSWINCTVWGKRSDTVTKYLHKGDQVTVSGLGHHAEYERKDGTKGYSIEVKVQDFTLPVKPKADEEDFI